MTPYLVVKLLTILWGIVKCVLVGKVVCETSKGAAGIVDQLFVCSIFLLSLLLCWVQLVLVHWQTHVWRSLVDGEVLDLWSDLLNGLDTRGTSTDNSHALSLEVCIVLRPLGGVEDFSLEVTETWERWRIVLRGEADVGHKPLASDGRFVGAFNEPFVRLLIEGCSIDAFVKDAVGDIS